MAYPTGHVEVAEGTVRGTARGRRHRHRWPRRRRRSASTVSSDDHVDGDELRYTLAMAAVGEPLTPHLAATLRRDRLTCDHLVT